MSTAGFLTKMANCEQEPGSTTVSPFRVCVLGSAQCKVTDVITLHKVCPSSLNMDADSKCHIKMQTRRLCLLVFPTMLCLLDFSMHNCNKKNKEKKKKKPGGGVIEVKPRHRLTAVNNMQVRFVHQRQPTPPSLHQHWRVQPFTLTSGVCSVRGRHRV